MTYRLFGTTIVTTALLVGCAMSEAPIGPPTIGQPTGSRFTKGVGSSWISPAAKTSKQLLYVVDSASAQVSVVSLPQGKLVGTLDGFSAPYGACADDAGDVFIVDARASQIWEYAHGAKSPKAILQDSGYEPIACSVDPKTGDLAVTNIFGSTIASGNIIVFAKARGKPTMYRDPSIENFDYCDYDGNGNLYAGGQSSADESLFAYLPKGQKTLKSLTLNGPVNSTSPLRWDGQDLAVLDGSPGSIIYRFEINGGTGTEVGLLKLRGTSDVADFWIQDGTLYAPLYNKSTVATYAYPRGGGILDSYLGFGGPTAAVVSNAL